MHSIQQSTIRRFKAHFRIRYEIIEIISFVYFRFYRGRHYIHVVDLIKLEN